MKPRRLLLTLLLSVVALVGGFFVWQRGANDRLQSVADTVPITTKQQIEPAEPSAPVEKEKEDAPPARINLDVPFTSQAPERNWDQPWQDACEEAAVLMVDAYIKGYALSVPFAKEKILAMVAWQDARGWKYSISAEQVGQFMREYSGLSTVRLIENPTIEQIKQFIAAGKPVLVLADGKALPNPYFSGDGPVYHALIIRGYTEDSFITNDPGTWRGENFVYRYSDLMNAIHEWNGGDVRHGRKFILVVEEGVVHL
jgi:hypothetical protein